MKGRIFEKILLEKGNVKLFLCLKEKVTKRSKQTCSLIAVCSVLRSPVISAQKPAQRRRTICLPKQAELFRTPRGSSSDCSKYGSFFDTPTSQHIFPPSYLAPNGLSLRSANLSPYSEGIKSDLGGVIVLFVHPKKSCHTIKILQRTDERRNPFRQAKSSALAQAFA